MYMHRYEKSAQFRASPGYATGHLKLKLSEIGEERVRVRAKPFKTQEILPMQLSWLHKLGLADVLRSKLDQN